MLSRRPLYSPFAIAFRIDPPVLAQIHNPLCTSPTKPAKQRITRFGNVTPCGDEYFGKPDCESSNSTLEHTGVGLKWPNQRGTRDVFAASRCPRCTTPGIRQGRERTGPAIDSRGSGDSARNPLVGQTIAPDHGRRNPAERRANNDRCQAALNVDARHSRKLRRRNAPRRFREHHDCGEKLRNLH